MLDALGRLRSKYRKAWRTHDHDALCTLRIVESELDRGGAAQRIANEARARDVERVHEVADRLGHEGERAALNLRLVALRETRQVGQDNAKTLGEMIHVAAVSGPSAGPPPAPLKHDYGTHPPRLGLGEFEQTRP